MQYAERTTECHEYEGICRINEKPTGNGDVKTKTKQLSLLKYQRYADGTATQSIKIAREMWTPLTL